MEVNNILKIIEAFENSSVTELDFQEGNQKISLRKNSRQVVVEQPDVLAKNTVADAILVTNNQAAKESNSNLNVIKAPLVGTFYAAKGVGEQPFVSVGDQVKKGQVVAIIEAMKLMNEVVSEYDGVVEEILVENENLVEYGQELFRIK